MDGYKCLNCLVLREQLDLVEEKMNQLKECNKKIKEYNERQIKLTNEIKDKLDEYKKLKKYCNY